MKTLYMLLFILFAFVSKGQNSACDGDRYKTNVFDDIEVVKDIKFSEGITFSGANTELFMDVYAPANDQATERPAILFAFGGSFISGERGDVEFACNYYASLGYVAVAIDYRLYDGALFPIPSAETMQDVVIKAVGDVKAAIRFLRHDIDNGNTYGIDGDLIYTGGISAGSIATAHAAVIDENDTFDSAIAEIIENNGGLEGADNTHIEYSSDITAYINFSGGLNNVEWIDESDPPFVSVHDDGDDVVPYGDGFATIFGFEIVEISGSFSMHERALEVGVESELHTIENSNNHVSYFFGDSTTAATALFASSDFIYDYTCPVTDVVEIEAPAINIYPNPSNGIVNISGFEGPTDLAITSLYGKRIDVGKVKSSYDLTSLNSGIYFFEFTPENNASPIVKKVIVE